MSNAEENEVQLMERADIAASVEYSILDVKHDVYAKGYIAGYNEAQQELTDLKAENSMLMDFINKI